MIQDVFKSDSKLQSYKPVHAAWLKIMIFSYLPGSNGIAPVEPTYRSGRCSDL
jgi:hypothetical protein